MIQIAIREAAFAAIAKTMPLGSAGYENKSNERGSFGSNRTCSTGSGRCAAPARTTAT
jgi:hypothetical protein